MWDVRGTHRSFGQLLLLGRAAHCVSMLERAQQHHTPLDGAALIDLEDGMGLMVALCRQQPSLVSDLMSLSVSGVNVGLVGGRELT